MFNYKEYQVTSGEVEFNHNTMDLEFKENVIFEDKTDYMKGDIILFSGKTSLVLN